MTQQSTTVRPRYARIGLLAASLGVTTLSVLGGFGVLPSSADDQVPATTPTATLVGDPVAPEPPPAKHRQAPTGPTTYSTGLSSAASRHDASLPKASGSGTRVVFSQSRQRIWLVSSARHVERTYLVSGSRSDNLSPGTYSVYSRSRHAWGINDSGTMGYFVRFTRGDTGAAIGFHDIPVKDGKLVESAADLGTAQSHGCIRQWRPDAIALWHFAPLGSKVVVTA
ncbi:MAG: L,D-transpeptidase [Nocardioides sp.]